MKKRPIGERIEDARDWCIDNWNVTLIALVVVVVMAFGGWKWHQKNVVKAEREAAEVAKWEHKQAEAAEAERLAALQAWPALPEPPLPTIGTPPATPILNPLGFTVTPDSTPTPQQITMLQLRLKQLVESHPRPEINTAFNARVVSGELMLNFQTQSGEFAAFGVFTRNSVQSMQRNDTRPLLPTFIMSLTKLAGLTTPEEIREAWLVLYHENRHYEQWRVVAPAEQGYLISREIKRDEQLSTAECEFHWKVEHDAYEQECRLALEWGMPDVWNGLCRRVDDTPAFDQMLFNWFNAASPMRSCLQTWGIAAGHPHPEAFALPH